jgi:hypothetical protein
MSTSEQLERETEKERARISETLDELRARMTPGHVVDRLVDYATDSSGGMFFRNLRQQAVNNPVPVALVGAGLAWLAISGRRRDSNNGTSADDLAARTTGKVSAAARAEAAERVRHAADIASDAASRWSGQVRSAAGNRGRRGQHLRDTARGTADSVADTASSAYAAASELAGDATARSKGAARSAVDISEMRGKVTATGRSIKDFVYQQPLVLVGLGVAIGAAIGAASPSTEAEDELMGESSDAVKEQTADAAKEQVKKGQAVAEQALQSATEEAEKQGLASSSAEGEGAFTPQLDSASNETPLVPSTEASESREDKRSEH